MSNPLKQNEKSPIFDYVIVGAGSAGCVLANRLSEDPNCRVCLLEAGPSDSSVLFRIPIGTFFLMRSHKYNWQYHTVKQKNCAEREMLFPRGKTLGGSSSMNAMCFCIGHPSVYNKWASLGNTGWAYEELQPYIKKMKQTLSISKPRSINILTHAFIDAGKQMGLPLREDFDNNSSQESIGYYRLTQCEGQRCSNAVAYLKPAIHRSNLTIITNALAAKILLSGKHATGVLYLKEDKEYTVKASREVLICAGTIGSPQLLLLSGIGPSEDLTQVGIKTLHELPGVGMNLQDHIDIHLYDLEKTKNSIILHPKAIWRYLKSFFQYCFKKTGEMTTNYAQAGAFLKSDPKLTAPDLQLHFLPVPDTKHAQNIKPVIFTHGYTLLAALLNPKSRGSIKLKSGNPYDYPLIDPNYFADKSDLDKLILAIKRGRELLNQSAFAKYKLKEQEPDENIKTDTQIREYITAQAETAYHPVGTCKMGQDDMAVVDSTLKVHGITSLRIVDASIMPTITFGNTNAPTTIIAEKAADLIMESKGVPF